MRTVGNHMGDCEKGNGLLRVASFKPSDDMSVAQLLIRRAPPKQLLRCPPPHVKAFEREKGHNAEEVREEELSTIVVVVVVVSSSEPPQAQNSTHRSGSDSYHCARSQRPPPGPRPGVAAPCETLWSIVARKLAVAVV